MNINIFVPNQNAFAQCEDVKSFVDDLSLGQGVVLSRVASTLRSIETQPFDRGFVRISRIISFRLKFIQIFVFFKKNFEGRLAKLLVPRTYSSTCKSLNFLDRT